MYYYFRLVIWEESAIAFTRSAPRTLSNASTTGSDAEPSSAIGVPLGVATCIGLPLSAAIGVKLGSFTSGSLSGCTVGGNWSVVDPLKFVLVLVSAEVAGVCTKVGVECGSTVIARGLFPDAGFLQGDAKSVVKTTTASKLARVIAAERAAHAGERNPTSTDKSIAAGTDMHYGDACNPLDRHTQLNGLQYGTPHHTRETGAQPHRNTNGMHTPVLPLMEVQQVVCVD